MLFGDLLTDCSSSCGQNKDELIRMRLLYTLLFVCVSLFSNAQQYNWEIGGGLGTSNYFGDIGGIEFDGQKGPADIMLNTTRFNIALFGRKYIDYRWYVNVQASFINITGDDKLSPGTARESRNLSFENNLFEGIGMVEFHPLIINDLGGKKRHMADLHVHVGTGLGVAYSEPVRLNGGSRVKLRPLATEGEEKKYAPLQMVIPLSAGFFVSLKGRYSGYRVHRFGININYRVTFTDYLDDVSTVYPELAALNGDESRINASWRGWNTDPADPTFPEGNIRGNPNSNDGYFTTMLYYSKRIRSRRKSHKIPRRQEFYGRSRRMKMR
ncbi:MAG: hypothetical protein ACI9GM_001075 [Salibacteraceae bacterium]|jgi:hypothetical protein